MEVQSRTQQDVEEYSMDEQSSVPYNLIDELMVNILFFFLNTYILLY
jgi:hypothetical protein